jgi:hypothetical protein
MTEGKQNRICSFNTLRDEPFNGRHFRPLIIGHCWNWHRCHGTFPQLGHFRFHCSPSFPVVKKRKNPLIDTTPQEVESINGLYWRPFRLCRPRCYVTAAAIGDRRWVMLSTAGSILWIGFGRSSPAMIIFSGACCCVVVQSNGTAMKQVSFFARMA